MNSSWIYWNESDKMFKFFTRKIKYNLACRKFFPLHYRSTNEVYDFCNSDPQALYPSEFPPDPCNSSFNDHNVITKDYLHEFYYGDLLCFKEMYGQDNLLLTPSSNSSNQYKNYFQRAKKMMHVECELMQTFKNRRLITLTDIKKLFKVDTTKATKIWNAPEITDVGYPVDDSQLSKIKFNVYNEILSPKSYYGFKKVDHNGIAFALYHGSLNYQDLKEKLDNLHWSKKFNKEAPKHSSKWITDNIINHSLKQAEKQVNANII